MSNLDYESFMKSKKQGTEPEVQSSESPEPTASKPLMPKKKKKKIGMPILVGIGVFIVIAIIVAVFAVIGGNQPQPQASPENLAEQKAKMGTLEALHVDGDLSVYDQSLDRWTFPSTKAIPFGTWIMSGPTSNRNIFTVNKVHTIRAYPDSRFVVNTSEATTGFKQKVGMEIAKGSIWVEGGGEVFEVQTPTGTVVSDGGDFQIILGENNKTTIICWNGTVLFTPSMDSSKVTTLTQGKQCYIDGANVPVVAEASEQLTDWQKWNQNQSNEEIFANTIKPLSTSTETASSSLRRDNEGGDMGGGQQMQPGGQQGGGKGEPKGGQQGGGKGEPKGGQPGGQQGQPGGGQQGQPMGEGQQGQPMGGGQQGQPMGGGQQQGQPMGDGAGGNIQGGNTMMNIGGQQSTPKTKFNPYQQQGQNQPGQNQQGYPQGQNQQSGGNYPTANSNNQQQNMGQPGQQGQPQGQPQGQQQFGQGQGQPGQQDGQKFVPPPGSVTGAGGQYNQNGIQGQIGGGENITVGPGQGGGMQQNNNKVNPYRKEDQQGGGDQGQMGGGGQGQMGGGQGQMGGGGQGQMGGGQGNTIDISQSSSSSTGKKKKKKGGNPLDNTGGGAPEGYDTWGK